MKYLEDWQFWVAWLVAAIVIGFVFKATIGK